MNLDAASALAVNVFAYGYGEAREKFLRAAPKSKSYRSEVRGPAGEDLFTDVAYFGDPDADNLLVLVSATHGVEGYCGSACQMAFLEAGLANAIPNSVGVLMVHALNCYGFAWDRRVTHEGVDLNRNFVDFPDGVPVNDTYGALADFVVPRDFSEAGLKEAQSGIDAFKARFGELAYRQAVAGGQHSHSGGVFFGGNEPTEARLTLEKISRDYRIADRSKVVIIDYHSGLGPYGYGELQCEETAGLDGYERARAIFGETVTSPMIGNSTAVSIVGSQDAYWERLLGDRHTYIALEFGTYPSSPSLRKDHWLFQYQPEDADTELGRAVRSANKDQFYPQRQDWQEMVVWRAHQVHRQALAALGTR